MTTYAEKLKDPRWQRKRLEVLEAANWACETCGAEDKTLHVHHKRYLKGHEPWEYENEDLRSLCEDCHEEISLLSSNITAALNRLNESGRQRVLGYIEAIAGLDKGFRYLQIGPLSVPDEGLRGIADYVGLGEKEIKALANENLEVSFSELKAALTRKIEK